MILAPSILSLDYSRFNESMEVLNRKCRWLHFDVMDGNFVPNLSFGPDILKCFRKNTSLFLDVHLMVKDPKFFTKVFAENGADGITFHYEALENKEECLELIDYIHSFYLKAGVSIKPGTDPEAIKELLPYLDLVLVMSVEPGFGGQSFMENSLDKVKWLKEYKDENDLSSGIIAVVQDITEHVKLDDMRKEFVADVSHELKTPITSIIGYADTLQDGDYDKETQQRFLSVISSEGRRMADLVSDLLTLSRYDTNRMTRELTIFDLGEVAKKCQEKLAIEIEKKKQNVECYVTADVPPIEADKNGIERVILNVLSNAVKYTQEEGNIKIYVGFVYNDAYIKVIDNGIGIPKDDLSRVFERFYRVDKARSREMGGTGLGLSIAKEIIEQNNGSIDIKSELGKGTEVVIRIPAVKKA